MRHRSTMANLYNALESAHHKIHFDAPVSSRRPFGDYLFEEGTSRKAGTEIGRQIESIARTVVESVALSILEHDPQAWPCILKLADLTCGLRFVFVVHEGSLEIL